MNEQSGVHNLNQQRRDLLDGFYSLLEGIDVTKDFDVLQQVVRTGSRVIEVNTHRPRSILRVVR